jgi:site-specific recombinase XerD
MRAAGDTPDGLRLRGVIVVLWRAGLRISEALALNESDLDSERGAVLVRHGKGDKRREVGMDRWASDLGITSVYLRGIDNTEIVHAVHERPAPMISAHKRASARSLSRPATEAAPSTRPRPPANRQRAPTALPAE